MTALHRTPGPWELIRFGGPQIGHRASGEAVCTMWGSQEDPEDAFAGNVALITAAPELLHALAGMIPTNLGAIPDTMSDSETIPLDVTVGELRSARAAIAKATGA